jgi:nucleotide-binding universal stress UspA family protein
MGTHKRSMFKKILNGSIAERVMTSAACPVTIVRDID